MDEFSIEERLEEALQQNEYDRESIRRYAVTTAELYRENQELKTQLDELETLVNYQLWKAIRKLAQKKTITQRHSNGANVI